MRRIGLALAALLLVAAGTEREPDGYAVRLRVTPAPGGGVQRIALPAAAIVALRNRDGSDVRVFDAHGRAVPLARVAPAAQSARTSLAALPILGDRDTRMGARVSVRLDTRGRARVAEVESGGDPSGETAVLGALLDARRVRGTAERLAFDADMPAGQPVRFTVEASRDLDRWRTLGERVLYRAPGAPPVRAEVSLGSAALDGDSLRVTWRPSAPVTVRGAVLVSGGARGRIVVLARAPALVEDHALEFVAPAAAPVSLRIMPVSTDGAVAVRVLGRDDRERPWAVLASGMASADAPAVTLGDAPRMIRIEADRRGAGFSAPPALELGFAPRAIAFAAAGRGPFVLAAGRAGAEDMFTALGDLTGAGELAEARVEGGTTVAPLALSAPDGSGGSRQALLWAVLLAAVALLGGLVWWLMRRPAEPA